MALEPCHVRLQVNNLAKGVQVTVHDIEFNALDPGGLRVHRHCHLIKRACIICIKRAAGNNIVLDPFTEERKADHAIATVEPFINRNIKVLGPTGPEVGIALGNGAVCTPESSSPQLSDAAMAICPGAGRPMDWL